MKVDKVEDIKDWTKVIWIKEMHDQKTKEMERKGYIVSPLYINNEYRGIYIRGIRRQ